ncbi:asparagine synthase (glutamine-hydrolyzing) [Sphaerisporangium sp. TRM90804]|uniref:asparagine synthase (glutamine-hydrolyzing) n=1 Tax=Sphaerisporangium sp. TRM90804 TaxID=3031113 RepID=UPI00244ADF98|nr:asparagine synthase (glutamine-hydrolyzing) [Sphaerisporangium sp. TRM90804]MDH2429146.1 asparagine synthase (glutamine-hydrolyzing) [Sphaerisporangium sp. TRM90804]
MCGICGWVDFRLDLDEEVDALRAMTGTMACRGPDDEGMWTSSHGALGHRRLAIIDIEGGLQPMVAEHERRVAAVLSYSGEVYNFQELREELAAHGHRFHTRSDTEVVLRAYEEWGADLGSHLNGMYAFAIWDAEAERMVLVRDRLGIKPLYYFPTPDGVLFGSEPKAILANPLARAPVVDAEGLRELLGFVKTPEHGIYQGMHEVRPGGVVQIDRNGVSTDRYWKLEAEEHPDDLPQTIRTVRGLLEDIVERQLISDVPLCTLLSGGLDSSAVTALAARALRGHGQGGLRSFSVDFVGYAENFSPDEMRDTPDTPYVHDLVRHLEGLGVAHKDIVLDSVDLMDPGVRAAVLRARDVPFGMGDMDTSLYLLFAAIRTQSTVALSGESADEVFGGYRWFHDPEPVHAGTFPWLAAPGNTRYTALTDILRDEVAAELDLPAYRARRYRQALDEVPRLPGENGLEARMREICYLHLTRFVQILLDRKDRMSMASGLEVRVPFCDHRLVQYVFNTPWSMKTFDGHEKSLLRAAVRDVLPRSVAERRKSPYPSTQDPGYEKALRAEAAKLLERGGGPVAQLVDLGKVRRLLDLPQESAGHTDHRSALEGFLQFDSWLETYPVRLSL